MHSISTRTRLTRCATCLLVHSSLLSLQLHSHCIFLLLHSPWLTAHSPCLLNLILMTYFNEFKEWGGLVAGYSYGSYIQSRCGKTMIIIIRIAITRTLIILSANSISLKNNGTVLPVTRLSQCGKFCHYYCHYCSVL